jgi:hypothetical protein
MIKPAGMLQGNRCTVKIQRDHDGLINAAPSNIAEATNAIAVETRQIFTRELLVDTEFAKSGIGLAVNIHPTLTSLGGFLGLQRSDGWKPRSNPSSETGL